MRRIYWNERDGKVRAVEFAPFAAACYEGERRDGALHLTRCTWGEGPTIDGMRIWSHKEAEDWLDEWGDHWVKEW